MRLMTLYAMRPVTNATDIRAHYQAQGVPGILPASDMHVTVIFSRKPVDWMEIGAAWSDKIEVTAGGPRLHERFGAEGDALVLQFQNWELHHRNEMAREKGASWDWPDYRPHITISYRAANVDMDKLEPWTGPIILGPEMWDQVDENWKAKVA